MWSGGIQVFFCATWECVLLGDVIREEGAMCLDMEKECCYASNMSTVYFYLSTKVCGWLFAVAALVWLGVAGYFWFSCIEEQSSWSRATATVTEICEEKGANGTTKYSRLTFVVPETGQSVTVRSQAGASERPVYPVGDEVEVIFPAEKPDEAIENNVIVVYLLPFMFSIAALLFGVVSFAAFHISRKLKKKLEVAA